MTLQNPKIINGVFHSEELLKKVSKIVTKSINIINRKPCIAVILVGCNPASEIYVKNKIKIANTVSIDSKKIQLQENISEQELLNEIHVLNNNKNIDGILVQLPLPSHISEKRVTLSIDPEKDVDGFHPINLGHLLTGDQKMIPCTPLGCLYLLKSELKSLDGLSAVIIGRSNIVGKPMQCLLLKENCTVTIAHSKTKNLSEITSKADILIAAVGKANLINKKFVKSNSTIIDVGINRLKHNDKNIIVGDVQFLDVIDKAKKITPVPGGVGPMTIACLMYNTVKASFVRNNYDFKENIFDE